MLSDLLTIVIITYNRAPILQRTLRDVMDSPMGCVPVIVLNNASTDSTAEVCAGFAVHPNFRLVTNKFNIGADANIMRAYEYADTPYVWVMGDDDDYDLTHADDLERALATGRYDVVQIGCTGNEDYSRFAGRSGSIKELMAQGYNYYRLASNISCSIVRVAALRQHVIRAYQCIANHLPHMAILMALAEADAPMYVTRDRMLRINVGDSENYTYNDYLNWWIDTAALISSPRDRRAFYLAHHYDAPSGAMAGMILKSVYSGYPSFGRMLRMYRAMTLPVKVGALAKLPGRLLTVLRDKRCSAR